MNNKYLVISRCDDLPSINYMSEAEVVAALNDEWLDYRTITEDQLVSAGCSLLAYFPPKAVLIVWGKICHKQAVEKVVEWMLV